MSHTLINGQLSGQLSVNDRGLHYGDGLFETILLKGRFLQLWCDHLSRLTLGCHTLRIKCPDEKTWLDDINKLVAMASDDDFHVIKMILTRGEGQRGYAADDSIKPTRITSINSYSPVDAKGQLRICTQRVSQNVSLAGIKHLNRLDSVLARGEWGDDNIIEGLMLDEDSNVIEGTRSNIFFFLDEQLFTPELKRCGVQGVMRQRLIETAQSMSVSVHIKPIPAIEIENFTGACITNSLLGVYPVAGIGEHIFSDMNLINVLKVKLEILIKNNSHGID